MLPRRSPRASWCSAAASGDESSKGAAFVRRRRRRAPRCASRALAPPFPVHLDGNTTGSRCGACGGTARRQTALRTRRSTTRDSWSDRSCAAPRQAAEKKIEWHEEHRQEDEPRRREIARIYQGDEKHAAKVAEGE